MIGVDTNVLVRAVLDDSPAEASLAKRLLEKLAKNKALFVSSYAILEMVWVLKVTKCPREDICEAVFDLLDSPGIVVGQRDIVVTALGRYQSGQADFGDHLILAEGEAYQAPRIASFDKKFCKDSSQCADPRSFI